MPTFEELTNNTHYPVLHAKRSDGEIVIATRVPFTGTPWQQWGWILTLGKESPDSIECLFDNVGRRYPKIYTRTDILNYIEKWECSEWEAGYQSDNKIHTARITIPLQAKPIEEDVFIKAVSEIRNHQNQKTEEICNAVNSQSQINRDGIKELVNHFTGIADKLHREMLSTYSDMQKQLDTLVSDASNALSSINVVRTSINSTIQDELNEYIDGIRQQYQGQEKQQKDILSQIENLKDQIAIWEVNAKTLSEKGQNEINQFISLQINEIRNNTNENLEELSKEVTGRFDVVSQKLCEIQVQEKEIANAVIIEDEPKANDSLTEDVSSLVENTLKKTSSPIERMVARQVGIIYGYYKNVNQQAEKSLSVTHHISYIATAGFIIAMLGVIAAIILQRTEIAAINVIVALFSGIAAGVSKFNRTYEKAAEQRAYFFDCIKRFHELLLAYEICRKMNDETKREQKISEIISGLVKVEEQGEKITQQQK